MTAYDSDNGEPRGTGNGTDPSMIRGIIVVVAALVVGALLVMGGGNDDKKTSTTSSSSTLVANTGTVATLPSANTTAPATLALWVGNASNPSIKGLAGKVETALKAKGYAAATSGNADPTTFPATSTVYYAANAQADANAVATLLGISTVNVKPMPTLAAGTTAAWGSATVAVLVTVLPTTISTDTTSTTVAGVGTAATGATSTTTTTAAG